MISFPPAKINLGLYVIKKRKDGFHNIETVFYPVPWCDILEIVKAEEFKFFQTGLSIEINVNNNLCVKAYQLLKADFNLTPVHIHLHKIIPMGAGLGGGSSDAAHSLILLNKIFSLDLSTERLTDYASKLGSDCAFFLHQHPKLAKGKGEVLSSVNIDLKKYFFAIVMPPLKVSTAEAYQNIIPCIPTNSVKEVLKQPIEEWRHHLKNDFEFTVFEKYPLIKEIKQKLYAEGAAYACMSGSGAAVFGIFKKEVQLKKAFEGCMVWQG